MLQHFNPFADDPVGLEDLEEAGCEAEDITSFETYTTDALGTVRSPIAGQSELGDLVGDGPMWFTHCAFKLVGEAGEFAEHVGKAMRDDAFDITNMRSLTPERRMALIKELGDVLWYVVILGCLLGVSLLDIARVNVWKRRGRKQRGTLLGSGDNR